MNRPQKIISIPLIGLALLSLTLANASCSKEGNPSESEVSIQTVIERRVTLQEPSLGSCKDGQKYEWADYEYCYRVSFDRHGNKLEEYNCDEQRGFDYVYDYDGCGNIIKSCWYDWSSHDLELTNLYKYDKEGRVIEIVTQSGGKLFSGPETITAMKYDRAGNMIERDTVSNEDGHISKWTGRYQGEKLIESVSYHSDGSINYRKAYQYNDSGQKIESTVFDSKNTQTEKETFRYDNNGDMVELSTYDGNGTLAAREVYQDYEFDSNRQWSKRAVTLEFNSALAWGVDCGILSSKYAAYRTITYYENMDATNCTGNVSPTSTPLLTPSPTMKLRYEITLKADLSGIGAESSILAINEDIRIIEGRLSAYGVTDYSVTGQGNDTIVVSILTAGNLDAVIKLITATGTLDFREQVVDWQVSQKKCRGCH